MGIGCWICRQLPDLCSVTNYNATQRYAILCFISLQLELEVETLKSRLDSLRRAKNITIVRREREEVRISSPRLGRFRGSTHSLQLQRSNSNYYFSLCYVITCLALVAIACIIYDQCHLFLSTMQPLPPTHPHKHLPSSHSYPFVSTWWPTRWGRQA